jgi:succinate dehydrogenase / fumarate reductase iron-sulfur subunit
MSEQADDRDQMRITLTAWRQAGPDAPGAFETYDVPGVSPDMSFLEMLDLVNERLIVDGTEPIAFDHDCREGICGSCGMMINGQAHGPERNTATCQLHMRKYQDGDEITIEPWRAAAFPLIKDLIVDRSPFDAIIEAGGYIAIDTGGAVDGNAIPVPKQVSDAAMDAAACPNGAAQLFTSAKLQHLNLLPQGQAERWDRTIDMVDTMENYFGSCTNHQECEAACPKSISIDFIALMNRDYVKAQFKQRRLVGQSFP